MKEEGSGLCPVNKPRVCAATHFVNMSARVLISKPKNIQAINMNGISTDISYKEIQYDMSVTIPTI